MSICVVHLVRASNGLVPFEKFIRSYTHFRAGLQHDLLIVFKGFRNSEELSEYKNLLNGLEYQSVGVTDWGYDIRAYILAAKRFDYQYFCFLNSFSVILDHEWLSKMYSNISREKVGLVGATGSYESVYSDLIMLEKVHVSSSLCQRFKAYLRRPVYRACFNPFPNWHIRTNAFMISRNLLLKVRCGNMFRKFDALRFENGKNSLTRQILGMGLRVLVVGRDGKGFEKGEWLNSNTYCQGNQENLLVADNRTRGYLLSGPQERESLSKMVWGGVVGFGSAS